LSPTEMIYGAAAGFIVVATYISGRVMRRRGPRQPAWFVLWAPAVVALIWIAYGLTFGGSRTVTWVVFATWAVVVINPSLVVSVTGGPRDLPALGAAVQNVMKLALEHGKADWTSRGGYRWTREGRTSCPGAVAHAANGRVHRSLPRCGGLLPEARTLDRLGSRS
jgi:predicted MFS family arabinose efflux permease